MTTSAVHELEERIRRLERDNARLRAVIEALPKCYGTWVSGEGMDAVFARDCPRPATWNDERDDLAYPWRFCDVHKPDNWPALVEEYPYADALRALEAEEPSPNPDQ